MTALQALDLAEGPAAPSPIVDQLRAQVRQDVPTVEEDRCFEPDMERLYRKVKSGELVAFTEALTGRLPF